MYHLMTCLTAYHKPSFNNLQHRNAFLIIVLNPDQVPWGQHEYLAYHGYVLGEFI